MKTCLRNITLDSHTKLARNSRAQTSPLKLGSSLGVSWFATGKPCSSMSRQAEWHSTVAGSASSAAA